jgi:hypothetical protein
MLASSGDIERVQNDNNASKPVRQDNFEHVHITANTGLAVRLG